MPRLLRSILVAAGLWMACAMPASALTTQTVTAGPLSGDYGSGVSALAPGLFLDYWTFTLPTASVVTGSAFNVVTSPAKLITEFSAQFLDGSATPIYTFLPATTLLPGGQTLQTLSTPALQLNAGSYSLLVAGVAGSGGPAFSINLSVTPVPEPQVYGMLLAGFGLIGAVARRRRG